MNNLYEAVMILGRSLKEIDRTGWMCGTLGVESGPKCANALLTMSSEHRRPVYLSQAVDVMPELEMPLRIAAKALVEATPAEVVQALRKQWDETPDEYEYAIEVFENPLSADLLGVGDMLATINDAEDDHGRELLTTETARQWFSDALDRLAEELPIPAAPVVPEHAPVSEAEMERYLWDRTPERI